MQDGDPAPTFQFEIKVFSNNYLPVTKSSVLQEVLGHTVVVVTEAVTYLQHT